MPPKRKRSNTAGSVKKDAMDVVQPSSRDASDEGAEDSVLQEVTSKKERQAESAKRGRAGNPDDDSDADDDDDERVSKKSRRSSADRIKSGENGEAATMRMEAPPGAGLTDPAGGFKTNPPAMDRPIRVYADGVFDLFHIGHMRALQQAKTAFAHLAPNNPQVELVVGVTGDTETHKRKGLTVLSARERAESVRHCKWVDEVVPDCPWIVTTDFLEQHKIDYVAHDDLPYGADEGDDIYGPIKERGMFLVTQRTEGLSTTGIITKIVRDYDQYVDRQLKRGTSRKELNVSWLKKNELDLKRNMVEFRDSIKANWATTGQELTKDFRQFWQSSRPASPARTPTREHSNAMEQVAVDARSPSALSRLSHLDIPRASAAGERSSDFAAGYNLGLIGGVRAWMARSRRNLNDSRPQSPSNSSEDEREDRSPQAEPRRGRSGKKDDLDIEA
ncbi:Nucleotidylyl transferase [Didymella exigua CBS 183.55]|uniref:choline-phosphate cytidylyltransferase n=1 Tax=Didymella exigua CBS 183.55 TaxID=1150837 RepID=A0A6A5RNA4_9PLEO|nr:Nucleotidylyl transferase [Didymella exigua CBS 183.55]KAF1928780.1 Nucleotidylyl transferase [Didymella exigua CBS 183.55]